MIRTELAMRCGHPGCQSVFRRPCFRASPGKADYAGLMERGRLVGWLTLSSIRHYCPMHAPGHAPGHKPAASRSDLAKLEPTG